MAAPGAQQRAISKFIVFENFEKMNTQSVRQALSEKELAWLENLQPIAGNNLTTVPAPLAALAAIAQTIVSMFYADISGTDYLFAFTTAGSSWTVNVGTGATNKWAADGTFSQAPDLTTWTASRVLINDSVAGYCTYDGTIFAHQGTASPVVTITQGGFGYTSVPSVTISGGSGTGITGVAVLSQGSVIAVNITNPGTGYLATDVLTVTFGTGAGSGATAHAVMSGSAVASVSVTAPGTGYLNNAALAFSGGGGSGATGFVTVADGSGGKISFATVTNGGSNYTSPPSVTVAGGTGATFSVALVGQSVGSLVLDTPGTGYTGGAPSVVFTGGGGSNAAGHTTLSGTTVGSIVLDNGGSGYQTAPTVIITSGQGAAASAHVWPFIPAGTTLAVFQGRVWLAGGQLLQYTGTEGYDDFNSLNASGSLIISDADLVHAITALRNYNNYLFIMGDQSVKQIGNISLDSTGTVTLFTILTLSSDQGTIYPRSCGSYNRVFFFCNSNGVYAVFGSSVQKISDDMDGIFKLIDFSQQPQAAIADINAIHNIMFLVRYKDPLSTTRSLMLTFTGKKWFVVSQGNSITTIATASTLASGQTKTFSSSGTDVTQMLGSATTAVTFKAQSSLTHHGNAVQRKATIKQGFAVTAAGTATINVSMDTDEGSKSFTPGVVSGFQTYTTANPNVSGTFLGMTVTGTLAGFTLTNMRIMYEETNVGNK
jgi:hypothetical protein